MDATTLAQLLRMNPQNSQKLSQAWGQAQNLAAGVNNFSDAKRALELVGMTNNAIEQAGKLLNSPIAGIVATACGADISKARHAISKLLGQPAANGVDDLARLKAGLQQLTNK